MRPYDAKNLDQVCSLERDNLDTKGYWILIDGDNVTLCAQRSGAPATQSLKIPRKDFNKFVDWYMSDQAIPHLSRKPLKTPDKVT